MAEYRSWRNSERTWLKDVVPLDTPYNIHVDTSAVCNARCIYCGQSTSPGRGIMSMDMLKKIVDDASMFLHKVKLFDMYYTGEPLCNPNFVEMVKYVKKANVAEKIGVTTNGMLLRPELIDDIIAGGMDVIRISIQGLNTETYKRICGVEIDFDIFFSNLKYLYENRGNCKVRIKIADVALTNVPNGRRKFEEMFSTMADSIFVENIIPIYGDVKYDEISEEIEKNARNGRYGLEQGKINKVCYRPFIKLLVSINGDVSAACCDHISGRDIVYGNIEKENIVDIWNGKRHYDLMKMQLEGKRFEHMLCKECVVPNDIAYIEDSLDEYAKDVLKRFM